MRKLFATILALCMAGCNRERSTGEVFELQTFDQKEASAVAALRHIYEHVSRFVRPNITTSDVETLVARLLDQTKAEGFFKGYHNYPNFVCASVNEEVLHALPSTRTLRTGDLLKLEIGVRRLRGAVSRREDSLESHGGVRLHPGGGGVHVSAEGLISTTDGHG